MRRTGFAVLSLSMILACGQGGPGADAGPLVRELHDIAPLPGRWNVRLSVETPSGCADPDSLALESLRCSAATIPERKLTQLAGIAGRATEAIEAGVDVDALHAATIIDLLVADTVGKALDRSISRLEMLTRLERRRSAAWLDLSAAYLMRASARGEGRDLVASLDASTRALELDSTSIGASYNRALALDLLSMDVQAAREWRRSLRLTGRSSNPDFVRNRLARAESVREPKRPAVDAPPDSLREFVTRHSFEARLFAWEELLGGWAGAVIAGDTATASRRLTSATVIGDDLVHRFGDSSLVLAVRSIRSARNTSALAHAHAAFARGRDRTLDNNHEKAEPEFADVLANPGTSGVLREWATLADANSLLYLRRTADAERLAKSLLAQLDQRSDPSLAGRAWWMLAVISLRQGRDDVGLSANANARRSFELAGERDNHAATLWLEAERSFMLGDDQAFSVMVDALRQLRPYPSGLWRHNALYILATNATRVGLDRAAMSTNDEDAASATGNRAASVAELFLIRARALWEMGDTAQARQVTITASQKIDSLEFEQLRRAFRIELAFTNASGPLLSSGEQAVRLLDSVVAWHQPANRVAKLLPAYVARAEAALSLGRVEEAEADLARAAGLYEVQRDSITNLPERAALLARARGVFERLALVRLARGSPDDALAAVERGRTSFAPVGSTRREAATLDVPVLDFAFIDDTVLAWVVDGRRVDVRRTAVRRDSLLDTIERVRVAMELQSPESALRQPLARLYDWLVRPVEDWLGSDSTTLTIVSDAVLAEVPFAALFDSARGTYLVERRPLRWTPTLLDARRPSVKTVSSNALIVSSPHLDWRVFPGLSALPGAERETESVATFFAKPVVLGGREADSASVATALESASHFHFAGHALFDDARPNRSRLAVHPRGIDASAIAALDLRRLRLAVLSACETVRAPERQGAGFTGLTEAFLAAGTGGVIGTLWPVDDQLTGDFMRAFYGAYRESGDAAVALREAQRQMMRSTDGSTRPSAWAGFRLAGR